MKFIQNFRHDGRQNIVKRTPPTRLVRVFKNALQPRDDYANIFGIKRDAATGWTGGLTSTADAEYSPESSLMPIATDTASILSRETDISALRYKYELPLKRIDPKVVVSAVAAVPKVHKKYLINIINHLNFINEQVFVHIRNYVSGEEFFQQGDPGPYIGDNVTIRFTDSAAFDMSRHIPLHLVIDNRKSLIVFPVDLKSIDRESIVLRLPDMAHSYSKRQAVRHTCEGVDAEIVQGKINISGVLEDINPNDLRVRVNVVDEDISAATPLFLKLNQNHQTYFMGECRLLRSDKEKGYIVLQPIHDNRPVLKTRKYPNERVRITPQPIINFIHPLCGLAVQSKVEDICASGFSIIVPDKESLLIPGMVITQMTLQLPGMSSSLHCAVQVVYCNKKNKNLARYGFYILDMSLNDQKQLFDAVSKVSDPHVNLTGRVNMDSLWELFFDSGFIYPDKYGIINPYAEKLKATYRKLYEDGRDIFTHLTYQDQGKIYGHLSMVQAYENSWIIHHLAARPMRGIRTGLKTLNHFVNYIDCLYRLPVSSKRMRYNFCYYRPENIFSDYYFGGIFRTLKRRDKCSLDLFGYLPMHVSSEEVMLPEGWNLEHFSNEDITLIRKYYENMGGGMMLDVYSLECRADEKDGCSGMRVVPDSNSYHNIVSMYNQIGLARDCRVFSVRHEGRVKAALIVDTSDLGVNMSELLNSIKIIVIDDTLPWTILQAAVSTVGKVYESDIIMVLIYPYDYLGKQGVECKKKYNLWIINTNLDSNEKDVVKEHVRIAKRRFIREIFLKEFAKRRFDKLLAIISKQKKKNI